MIDEHLEFKMGAKQLDFSIKMSMCEMVIYFHAGNGAGFSFIHNTNCMQIYVILKGCNIVANDATSHTNITYLSFVHTKLQRYGFGIVSGIVTNCLFHTKRFPIVLTAICLHVLVNPHGTVLL